MPVGDRRLDQALVQVQRVGSDVDEDRPRAAQHEGVGRRDEGERRHDDFVARADVGEQRRHLQGGGAGMDEKHPARAARLEQERLAALGERSAAGQAPAPDCRFDVFQLAANSARAVEWDAMPGHGGSSLVAAPKPVAP